MRAVDVRVCHHHDAVVPKAGRVKLVTLLRTPKSKNTDNDRRLVSMPVGRSACDRKQHGVDRSGGGVGFKINSTQYI